MIRVRVGAATASILFAVIPAVMLGDATSDAKTQISALYLKEAKAAAKKDTKGMLEDYAPDFVATSKSGQKRTLAELKPQITGILQIMSEITDKTTVTKFALKGNTATVTVTEAMSATITPPTPPAAPSGTGAARPQAAQKMKLAVKETSEDVWVKSGKTWKKKSSRTVASEQTLNGQPIPSG